MNDKHNVKAQCPFYLNIRHGKTKGVTCEGVFKNSKHTTNFKNEKAFEEYFDSHCAGKYIDCKLYKAICRTYRNT